MRCAVLFTGGLDSQLAMRLMQRQGHDVTAIYFLSAWSTANDTAAAAIANLGIPLILLNLDGYAQRLRQPRLGFVGGAAPCLDCRIAMLARIRELPSEQQPDFIATGDVVGQRVRSSIRDLEIVDYHAGLEGRVLRPLSARLLPESEAEQRGWVDRSQLFDWQGKSRRRWRNGRSRSFVRLSR
jgi:adenylyl- and sulfurtransferase ThiI